MVDIHLIVTALVNSFPVQSVVGDMHPFLFRFTLAVSRSHVQGFIYDSFDDILK